MLFAKDKMDIFKEDLTQIAFYFTPVDQEFSKFLVTLDEVIQWYVQGENILKEKNHQIEFCRDYIKKNKNYLEKLGFARYDALMNVLSDLRGYKKELFELLGKDKPTNYIVILQNTNEKRPNGWFFWSFAFITVDGGRIKDLEIVDSYYPDFIAHNTRITAPARTKSFLPDRNIGYIAGNKFWFTDIDGKNLKDLYEKMFNETYDIRKVKQTMEPDLYNKLLKKYVKGVIFIRSDSLEKIIPGFTEKMREWQFLNAAVDLIRKEVRGNKKELYIKEVKEFFSKNSLKLLQNTVNNFGELAKAQFLNVYLSNASTWFVKVLQNHSLENVFKAWYIYAWDTNSSFNKVDGFVAKNIQIANSNGDIVLDSNEDIIDVRDLPQGKYEMTVLYNLNVPGYYLDMMHELEKKYDVTLTKREKSILAMQPATYDIFGGGETYKWRESKSTIYFPKNIKILNATGEIYNRSHFDPWFANGVYYKVWSNDNHSTRNVKIDFKIE